MITNPSVTDKFENGDLVVLRKSKDFDYRVISKDDFINELKQSLGETELSNQYLQITANTTIDLNTISLNIWVKILAAPITTYTLTVNLPLPSYAVNGQELLLSNVSGNAVNLTFNGFGATVVGSIASIASGVSATFKYDKSMNTWYKV